MTLTQVKKSMEDKVDVVKIFPTVLFGSKIIKPIRVPIAQAELLSNGGVSHDNVKD